MLGHDDGLNLSKPLVQTMALEDLQNTTLNLSRNDVVSA